MSNSGLNEREQRKQEIRAKGVEFHLAPATKYQDALIESDVVKMIEDNMDILLDAADTRKSSIDVAKLF